MMIVVTSTKGSAGVTTFAVALAAVFPGYAPVVVEADCSGGDLGPWHWLPDSPGIGTLAAQSRSGGIELERHVRSLPCGVDVILAPAGRHQATVAVGLLTEASVGMWAKKRPLIVDVGRLEPGTPACGLVEAADAVVLVSRGDIGSLLRLVDVSLPHGRTGLVMVGASAYSAGEISDRTGWPVVGQMPWDCHAAAIVAGRKPAKLGWTRRGMPACARAVAAALTGFVNSAVRVKDVM